MGIDEIIEEAIHLKPQDRYLVIENLIYSLDNPDTEIDEQWIEESLKRVRACREGSLKTVTYDEAFGIGS